MGVKLLGKIKIHEIAKETGISSKDLIEKAMELGLDVSSHMSAIDDSDAEKIKNSFKGVKNQKAKDEKKIKKESTPVIIRREVIINDDQNKKVEKKTDNRRDVGFVERDKNKDYNIVYRKQPVKPLTASELFGIKSKKQEEKPVQKEDAIQEVKPEDKLEVKPIEVKKENNKEMEQEIK